MWEEGQFTVLPSKMPEDEEERSSLALKRAIRTVVERFEVSSDDWTIFLWLMAAGCIVSLCWCQYQACRAPFRIYEEGDSPCASAP